MTKDSGDIIRIITLQKLLRYNRNFYIVSFKIILWLIISISIENIGIAQNTKIKEIASYQIEVKLDTKRKLVEGSEIITWFNTTKDMVDELRLHLYHNAYKNSNSSFCKEGKIDIKPEESGYTDIQFFKILNSSQSTPLLKFIRPDDNNYYDQTVLQVKLPYAVKPNQAIQINIGFVTKLPLGGIGRSGYARGREFYFVSQWFPKLGVYEEGKGWNCHQFHRWTEFFADFGKYEVKITIPKFYLIGATGQRESEIDNNNNTITYIYRQNDIHDFVWTASPEFMEIHDTFKHLYLPSTEIILLMQPEHKDQINRHLIAIRNALKYFGEFYGEYPYSSITVVDPPRTSSSRGMEYPMLITAGTNYLPSDNELSPEGVIIHEFGHQYWYGMVANNESEEAWLDEGITTYTTGKVIDSAYSGAYNVFRIGGGIPLIGFPLITYDEFPIIVYMGKVEVPFYMRHKMGYLAEPGTDPIYKKGWEYMNGTTYRIGSYNKPCLMLKTLENYLGGQVMSKVMKEYFQTYKFSHPKTEDFISIVEKVSGQNMSWFFSPLLFDSEILDYSISDITNIQVYGKNKVELTLLKVGSVKFPVEIQVLLENGRSIYDTWNGNEKWVKKEYFTESPAIGAKIDPYDKILLDVNFSNNSRVVSLNLNPVIKWSQQWLFWMQTFFLILSSIT
jgi:hypothetical protein